MKKVYRFFRALCRVFFWWVQSGFSLEKAAKKAYRISQKEKELEEKKLKQKASDLKRETAETVMDLVDKGSMNKKVEHRLSGFFAQKKPDIIDVVDNHLGSAFKVKDVDSGKVVYEKNIYKEMLVEVDEYLNDAPHSGISKGHFIHKRIQEVLKKLNN